MYASKIQYEISNIIIINKIITYFLYITKIYNTNLIIWN